MYVCTPACVCVCVCAKDSPPSPHLSLKWEVRVFLGLPAKKKHLLILGKGIVGNECFGVVGPD